MSKYRIVLGAFTSDGQPCPFGLEKLKEGLFWSSWTDTKLCSDDPEVLRLAVERSGGTLVEDNE